MSTTEEGFRRRLQLIMRQFGSVADLARAVGVTDNAIYKWAAGRGQPSVGSLVHLAKAAGVSVEWLATGSTPSGGSEMIERKDDRRFVASGNEGDKALVGGIGRSQVVEYIRFDSAWLSRRFDQVEPSRLMLIEVKGDAMAPTVDEGDLCLIEPHQGRFRHDGLYALGDPEEISIKRLQREPGGMLMIRSDNPAYAPIRVAEDQAGIIGRVLWVAGPP
jgi:phage repressor protein C with HTH and peptisase S24 domain